MKSSHFISIFFLLNFCFTQVIDDRCASEFETILESKCRGIGSCSYNLQSCIPISSCSGNTQEDCEKRDCCFDKSTTNSEIPWCYNGTVISTILTTLYCSILELKPLLSKI